MKANTVKPTLLSLFDYSGNWAAPYVNAGWNVIRQDIKHGQDIFEDTIPSIIEASVDGVKIHGILSAVPCTDFANSGARWFAAKETQPAAYNGKELSFSNTVEMSVGMALATLFIVELLKPVFWCIENPIGRINSLVPEIGKPLMYFNPCDFGDPYTKRTALYGNFNTSLELNPVLPLYGSMMHSQYGGKSEKTKTARSMTPKGFAQAFFKANH
jgi:hypothetical protein